MNVMAHWKLNDNLDTNVVIDETGVSNGVYHGTGTTDDYTSAHSVAGKKNQALDFDGTQDYIDCGNDSSIRSPKTIAFWFNSDDLESVIAIAGQRTDGSTKTAWNIFTGVTDFRIRFQIGDDGTSDNLENVTSSTDLSVSTWYSVVCVADETDIRIYVNGALDCTPTAAAFATYSSDADVKLGAVNDTEQYFYDGRLDNFILFNRALDIDDAKILYSAGHGTEIIADLDESRRIKRRPIWVR